MFKTVIDPNKKTTQIIKPEDVLPKTVENTRGELMNFDARKIIDSLQEETGLSKKKAIEITTHVLQRISSLGLEFIAAPHLRELICAELTAKELHAYRNKYTRLGIPIFDVDRILKEQKVKSNGGTYSSLFTHLWISSQVVEQFVHLSELNESASQLINSISSEAEKLDVDEKEIILNSLKTSLDLFHKKND